LVVVTSDTTASRLSLLFALAAAIAAVGLAAETAPASSDAAVGASAASTKFVSRRYGYEITLPERWRATYARRAWTGKFPLMDSGEVDFFEDRREHFFLVAATRLRAGTSLREWERAHAAVMTRSPYCERSRAFRSTRLGGVAAREFQNRCLVHDAIVVAAAHRGRGYTFQLVSPRRNTAVSDRRIFDTGRRSFRFTSR
jgi:hypothetical protein